MCTVKYNCEKKTCDICKMINAIAKKSFRIEEVENKYTLAHSCE